MIDPFASFLSFLTERNSIILSFTSVVGIKTVKTNKIVDSPLYKIRNNRATSTNEIIINNKYIGKDKDTGTLFSNVYINQLSIKKIMDAIQKMDEKEIENLLKLIKRKIPLNNMIEDH